MTKNEMGIDALIAVCKDLDFRFNISMGFKSYGRNEPKCTITLNNKTFTTYGENCFVTALKKTFIYVGNTFKGYEFIKAEIERQEQENKNSCEPCKFEIIKN